MRESSKPNYVLYFVVMFTIIFVALTTAALLNNDQKRRRPAAVQIYEACVESPVFPADRVELIDKCNVQLNTFILREQARPPQGYQP